MTQAAQNNAKVLYGLGVNKEDVVKIEEMLNATPVLQKVLESPVLTKKNKDEVIEKVFAAQNLPDVLVKYFKVMFRIGCMREMNDIFKAYYLYDDKMNNIIRAEIVFAKEPTDEEVKEAEGFLHKKYPDKEVITTKRIDSSLIGGYIVKTNHKEYDRSYEDKLRQIERKLSRR